MRISFILSEENNRQWTLCIDGEPFREVSLALFGRSPKISGIFSDKADFLEAFYEKERALAFQFVMKRLSMRAHTIYEVRCLLEERLVSPLSQEKVIETCIGQGYLNDEEVAAQVVRGQITKKQGPARIRMKLKEKGIEEAMIAPLLEEIDEEQQEAAIERLLSTRFAKRELTDPKERNKVIQALIRKGYSFSIIKQVIVKIL